MSREISSLAQLAETYPIPPLEPQPGMRHPNADCLTPRRVRVERSLLLIGGRRGSEDWSSTSFREGEGTGADESLGESGSGVKKKERGEMLISACFSPSTSSGFKKPAISHSRAGSLGGDSNLYNVSGGDTPRGSELDEADESWGVQAQGIRLGECSALSGQGVESLFRAISSILVERRGKIEGERTSRHEHSVILTDPAQDEGVVKGAKGRYACCV
jgi:hypothetical protein